MKSCNLFFFLVTISIALLSQKVYAEEKGGFNNFMKNIISPESESATEQQQFEEKVDHWVDSKATEIASESKDKLPFYVGGETKHLNPDQIPDLLKQFEQILHQAVTDFDKKDPETNFSTIGSLKATSLELSRTLLLWNRKFQQFSNEFDQQIVSGRILNLLDYCSNKNIDQSLCRSGVNARSSDDISAILIRTKFNQENSVIASFYKALKDLITKIESDQHKISNHSLLEESQNLIEIARENNCLEAKQIGSKSGAPFVNDATYDSFRPDPEVIYDLNGFIVQQSFDGGLLIKSSIRSSKISHRFFFVKTPGDYVDQHTFHNGEVFVCSSGLKSYRDTFGRLRKVHAFKSIQHDQKFYFLQ